MAAAATAPDEWRRVARHKLAALDEQIARMQAAREAISHGLRCRHADVSQCPNFAAGVAARLDGEPLAESHRRLHEGPHEGGAP